jgi:hypothetical protein
MAESSFLYDPSENINKGFAQFQAGLGNAFAQLIAQKQNDYVVAEKTFQNIDALTDKLGEYGQEEITNKTTDLMNKAANSIIKNGKLDYSAVGEIRNGVSTIKNRKSAIEAGTQMLKDWTQTSLATKDDLTSLTTTLSDLRGILLNPNNLSAQDMGKQMQAAYAKNINTTKVFGDTFKRIAPVTEFTETVDKDGNRYQVGGTTVSGFKFDKATGKFIPQTEVPVMGPDGKPATYLDGTPKTMPYMQKIVSDFKAQGAPAVAALRAQLGPNAATLTDEQLIADQFRLYVDNNNIANKNVLVADKNKLSAEASQAGMLELELKNKPTEIALSNQLKSTGIASNLSTIQRNKAEIENINNVGGGTTAVDDSHNEKTGNLPRRLPMIGKDASGKPVNFIATQIVNKNGKEFYVGYAAPKSLDYQSANLSNLQGFTPIELPVNAQNTAAFNAAKSVVPKAQKKSFESAINEYKQTPISPRPVVSISKYRQLHPDKNNLKHNELINWLLEHEGPAVFVP